MKQLGYFKTKRGKLYFILIHKKITGKLFGTGVTAAIFIICLMNPLLGLFVAGAFYFNSLINKFTIQNHKRGEKHETRRLY